MRLLAVNALRLSEQRTAIGIHIEHLVEQWTRLEIPFDKVILVTPHRTRFPHLESAQKVEFRRVGATLPSLLWEQWVLPRAAADAAVLLSFYTCPIFYDKPIVISNHGIYESIPQSFSVWQRLRATPLNRLSARRADRIIANSLNTKSDIIRHFSILRDKMDVIYEGPGDVFHKHYGESTIDSEVIATLGEKVPYVIFIGKLAKRRNVPNLIEAFSIVKKRLGLAHHLLIVGPNVNALPLQELAERCGIAQAVRHCAYVPQPQLAKLLAGAEAFVLPTTYEGISRTIYEAMASGTPVMTVDHPTLSEGGADAVLTVRSPGVDDLAQGLATLLGDAALRKRYSELGRARSRKFSMRECARATMEVLDGVARPAPGGRNASGATDE